LKNPVLGSILRGIGGALGPQARGKIYLFTALFIIALASPLFAYQPGDIVFSPEVQLGFEIPMIRQSADYPIDYQDGNYVSLGLCWGLRLSFDYHFWRFLSVTAGLGFEGVHNQYDFTYYNLASANTAYTERYTYDSYYFIIPAGFQAHIRALRLGAGLTGYLPVAAKFTGDTKKSSVHAPVTDNSFKTKPFLGAYFAIGYDWAERDGNLRGFNMNLRVESSFDDQIAEGNIEYKTFRHIAISLTAGYSFQAFRGPSF
jgi:hypothetical protein